MGGRKMSREVSSVGPTVVIEFAEFPGIATHSADCAALARPSPGAAPRGAAAIVGDALDRIDLMCYWVLR